MSSPKKFSQQQGAGKDQFVTNFKDKSTKEKLSFIESGLTQYINDLKLKSGLATTKPAAQDQEQGESNLIAHIPSRSSFHSIQSSR